MKTTSLIHLFVASSIFLTACGWKEKPVEEKVEERPTVAVQKSTVEKLEIDNIYTATVEPYKRNAITPSQSNRIAKILVEVGQPVRKGQLLVKMDETAVNQQRLQIANYEKDLARISELVAVGGASQQQQDQLSVQLNVAKEAMQLMMENTHLTSPIDGIITERNFDEGDMNNGQPVVTVMQICPVKLKIYISEEFFSRIKMGMDVSVKTDVYNEQIFNGKVSRIDPVIDPTSRTFGVLVTIPNSDLKVRPGMFARVKMNLGSVESITVPDLAVLRQPGSDERYVFIVENNICHYRSVKIGRRINDKFEILSGINPNEMVVVKGSARLTDGKSVLIK